MIKLIKTPVEYETALAKLEELVARSPEPNSPEGNQLELLGLLIEDYEAAHRPPPILDPTEAILFRMDQLDLHARDLIPFIGSRSKVSEVLAGKRPLTLPMIRALHEGLGIPTDVLLRPSVTPNSPGTARASHVRSPSLAAAEADLHSQPESFPWERFPIPEMAKRGWIPGLSVASAKAARKSRETAAKVLQPFFAPLGTQEFAAALFRRADHVRGGRAMDSYALAAWTAQVMARATAHHVQHTFTVDVFDDDAWIDEFVRLSKEDNGPQLAIDLLAKVGIVVLIEQHLPRTQLDGAAFLLPNRTPVVGLTLRHDRTDNFWYTLCHELAHVVLHLTAEAAPKIGGPAGEQVPALSWVAQTEFSERFYDNLDTFEGIDFLERQADAWAGEILVPDAEWRASAVPYTPSPLAVTQLADQIGVSEAVVAGKARFEYKNYRILNTLVGHGAVRRLFPNIAWSE